MKHLMLHAHFFKVRTVSNTAKDIASEIVNVRALRMVVVFEINTVSAVLIVIRTRLT